MNESSEETTGEWTPEFVMSVREGCEVAGVDFDTKIANGHNAAFNAERESHQKELDVVKANWSAELVAERENNTKAQVRAKELLAAERERRNLAEREWCGLVQQLREQLAGEREKVGKVQELVLRRDAEIAQLTSKLAGIDKQLFAEAIPKSYEPDRTLVIEQLQQQLAAERENYQRTVTDFLKCHAVETEEGVRMLAQRSFELHECQKQLAAERKVSNLNKN